MINTVTHLAAENPEALGDKALFGLENSTLGLLIVFAVLVVLCIIVKIVAGMIGANKSDSAPAPTPAPEKPTAIQSSPTPAPAAVPADNGELIAAITAAISMMLEAEGKDPRGFRVVSFRRSSTRK